MSKITLTDLVNLENQTTAVNAINANNAVLETASTNTLSRDGTAPNEMQATLDMNSNQIINLPAPIGENSPLRLQDLSDFVGGGTVTNIPAGGLTHQVLTKTSNADYIVDWESPFIEISYADTMVALRALAPGVTANVFLNGYNTKGDGGGGYFYWDASNSTADNTGTIIQPNTLPTSGRWVRNIPITGEYNVKWFGAVGDGITTTDGAAILKTVVASGPSQATILLPQGTYLSSVNCFPLTGAHGVKVFGEGGNNNAFRYGTTVIYTAASGSLMTIDGCEGVEVSNINLAYNNASYAGDLVDLRQITGPIFTASVHFHDFSLTGTPGSAINANSLVRLGNSIKCVFEHGFMQYAKRAVHNDAVNPVLGITINDIWFQSLSLQPITMAGVAWNICNCAVEPLTSTVAGWIVSTGPCVGCTITCNNIGDANDTGTWIDLSGGAFTGGSITDNMMDRGRYCINLGSSSGVSITGNGFLRHSTGGYIQASSATNCLIVANYSFDVPSSGPASVFDLGVFPSHSVVDNNDGLGTRVADLILTDALPVVSGGTGLTSGTVGGVPYFSGAGGTITSSPALTANRLVLGGGSSGPSALGSLGTTTTVLHGNAGGAPTFGAVAIGADVSGLGTGIATALAVNTGSAGAPVLFNGALGTPTSGTATNLTGTASGLTAGSVTTNANLTGDVTSVGNATTLTNAPVIAKVLTGYTSGAGTVSASDSILAAIQKLNGNDATNANLTGDVTSVGNATTLTNAPVIAKVLTGYTSGAGTVSSADSILAAIQKLNGNDATNANLTGDVTSVGNATTLTNAPVIAKVLTGYSAAAGTVASTDSILQAFNKVGGLVDNAAWTSYTPTVTTSGGSMTSTSTGLYKIIGKTMFIQCSVNVSSIAGVPTGNIFFTPPGGITLTGNQALSGTQNNGTAIGSIVSTGGFGQFLVMVPTSIVATTYYVGGTIPIT